MTFLLSRVRPCAKYVDSSTASLVSLGLNSSLSSLTSSYRCFASWSLTSFSRTSSMSHSRTRNITTTSSRSGNNSANSSSPEGEGSAPGAHPQPQQHFVYNRNLVQSRDYESYVVGLLHPPAVQPSYFALRALHVELASIQAKDTAVAAMRMKWWLDAIQTLSSASSSSLVEDDVPGDSHNNYSSRNSSMLSAIRGNPTVLGLEEAMRLHNLSHRFLERMVETRILDLERGNHGQFDTMEDMISFFERTHSALLFLNLECLGVADPEADKVANCIGISTGIVNMIRSIGHGHMGIPRDLVQKYGVKERYMNDPRRLISGEDPEGRRALRDAVMDMALMAGNYMAHARSHQGNVPREGKFAILPAVSCLRYLERLERLDYDVLEDKIREIEHVDTFHARWWKFSHLFYLSRAHLTGVF